MNSWRFEIFDEGRAMDTKPCRSCCEEINADARRCPYCQSFQSLWMAGNGVIPAMLFFLVLIGFSVVPLLQIQKERRERNIKFEDVQQLLTVADIRLVFEPPAKPPAGVQVVDESSIVWLYCAIDNQSDQDWENLEFFVEFRDANGERLDINNLADYSTVRSHTELEIRLKCQLAVDPTKVAETVVTITDASHDYY